MIVNDVQRCYYGGWSKEMMYRDVIMEGGQKKACDSK